MENVLTDQTTVEHVADGIHLASAAPASVQPVVKDTPAVKHFAASDNASFRKMKFRTPTSNLEI